MSHVHRQRQQQLAQAKQPAPQAQSGGWFGGLWNAVGLGGADTETELEGGEVEDVGKANEKLVSAGKRVEEDLLSGGDQSLFDEEKESEGEESSWWDYLPSFGAKKETERSDRVRMLGKDDDDAENYVDLLSSKSSGSVSGKIGAKGAEAEFELARSAALLEGAGKAEGNLGALKLEGGVEGSLMSAEGSAKGKLGLTGKGLAGEGEAEVGAYLAKVGGEAKGGLKIPFLNARLFGGAEAEGSIGVGAQAKGKFEAGANGFKMGGKLGASFGLGGALGFNWGVSKDDDKKGWLE